MARHRKHVPPKPPTDGGFAFVMVAVAIIFAIALYVLFSVY